MAFHGLGSAMGAYIGGWLTDRYGYYQVMFWSLFFVGFVYFELSNVTTMKMFCVVGFVISLIGDMFRPAAMASLIAYGGEEMQTRSMSLYRLAINLGFGLGMAAAGWIAAGYGYHILFYIDGGTCILAAFLFIFFLKNKQEEKPKKEVVQKIIRKSAYQDKWYLAFVGFLFLNSIVFFQLLFTFPLFCEKVMGMSEENFGWLMSYNGILIAILEMPMIYILAKKRDQMGWITFGVILIGLSYLNFNLLGFNIYSLLMFMTMISVGEIVNFPLASSLALGRSNPNNRGQYMGLYSMLFSIGFVIAPYIGFRIAEIYGYDFLWISMGILGAISTTGLMFLRKKSDGVLSVVKT